MALVRVAVPIPLAHEDTLVYEFPEETPEVGLRVLVPVGPRRVWGTVLGVEPKAPGFRVRKIAGIPEPRLVVTPELLELCRWVSDYYAANLSDVRRIDLGGDHDTLAWKAWTHGWDNHRWSEWWARAFAQGTASTPPEPA